MIRQVRRLLLIGLAFLLPACGSSSESPVTKAAPAISAEVAAAPGRLHLTDGRVLPAERWEEDGEVLFYEWKGERQMLLHANVARIEGQPRPRTTQVVPSPTERPCADTAISAKDLEATEWILSSMERDRNFRESTVRQMKMCVSLRRRAYRGDPVTPEEMGRACCFS